MIDSQARIIERLTTLEIDEVTRKFILDVMDFYKGHISKLQKIIIEKQAEVDEIIKLEALTNARSSDLELDNERLRSELAFLADDHKKALRIRELEMEQAMINFKSDVTNLDFDRRILEESVANWKSKCEILENQNTKLTNQVADLRADIEKFRFAKEPRNDVYLLNEIKEIKNQLNSTQRGGFGPSQTERFSPQPPSPKHHNPNSSFLDDRPEQISAVRLGRSEMKKLASKETRGNVFNEPPSMGDRSEPPSFKDTSEFTEMRVDDLEKYLNFLMDKQRETEAKMAKLPKKARNGGEIREKIDLEKEMETVTNEIASIRSKLKR